MTPDSLIELETKSAKRPRSKTTPEHRDKLNQTIRVNDIVAFSDSYYNNINLGTVIKLTRCRVRVRYSLEFRRQNGEVKQYTYEYLGNPQRMLVLSESLQSELLMYKLRGKLP